MNFSDFIAVALDAILALATLAFSAIVIPWIKNTAIPWLKEKRLYVTVQQFVNAAEKMADAGNLSKEDKKDYVVRMLASIGVAVDEQVDAMIESAVIELDIAFSEIMYEVETVFDEDEEEYDCDVEESADA